MVVAGVMSGTSADGVDVAVCRVRGGSGDGSGGEPRLRLLGHRQFPYTRAMRAAVLAAMDSKVTSTAELSRLHWRLGAFYAECVGRTAEELGARIALVGCHGQTVFHQARSERYLGAAVRCTWQIGEAAVVAEAMRCPVVSDFRPADLAAGGQAAPLVPMLDWMVFRSARTGRVLQNLGGIANLTALPKGCSAEQVLAFDTGPANMVIDGCMRRLFGKEFDRGGAVARRGRVLKPVVDRLLAMAYFSAPPPKSCGREQFGDTFCESFIERCRTVGATDADVIATATALTSASVVEAYARFVQPRMGDGRAEYLVAGGGAKNGTLMLWLQEGLRSFEARTRPIEDLGVAAEAKEAVAFALLAWFTWQRRAGNLPAATGAARPVILGKVSFG